MVSSSEEQKYLGRIARGFAATHDLARELASRKVDPSRRQETIKNAERQISDVLRQTLLQTGEGWLCEEDADDHARLGCDLAWVIDPVDGTQEFITGVPEWSVSVGVVVGGNAIAGGVFNPSTEELVLGSLNLGVTYNGQEVRAARKSEMRDAVVLASRQEFNRGEWRCFQGRNFAIRPTGSVAYKLALVAAGLADATWTLSPKHEWDVAAGVALINSSGARVSFPGGAPLLFNRKETLLPGLIASSAGIWSEVNSLISQVAPHSAGAD
jgi:myo-inositol-1(or 4)-monophosphatase